MRIGTISGSSQLNSRNHKLLATLPNLLAEHRFVPIDILELPLYKVNLDENPIADIVKSYRALVAQTDAIIISTPVYIYNMPAVLKNALEWLTKSGELYDKPVIPITFTPNPPRGEKAMSSLCNSLHALNAKVVTKLDLYQNEIFEEQDINLSKLDLLKEAISLL